MYLFSLCHMINTSICIFYNTDVKKAYVEGFQFFPFALKDVKHAPKGYLPIKFPTPDKDKSRFIKAVWTMDEKLAATSFEIKEKTGAKSKKVDQKKQDFCPKYSIFTKANPKDEAKVLKIVVDQPGRDQ